MWQGWKRGWLTTLRKRRCSFHPFENWFRDWSLLCKVSHKKKEMVMLLIQSNKTFITKHLAVIGRYWDLFSSKYDNFILLGDFNSEPCEQRMRDLCHVYNCQRIIKDKTFFKNPHNTSCVELFITNRPKIFKTFKVIETGLSDFHKTSLAVMKIFYKKQRLKILRY